LKTLTNTIPDPAPGQLKIADEITDKRGFAERWKFSVRHIDNLLSQGMPHCRIGKRRVRIVVAEADRWMLERFGVRRLGKENVAQ
jgi:hypothetical protein